MADVAKRLVGPLFLLTSNSSVYTVPANTTTIVRNIHISNNNSGTAYAFNLAINGTSASSGNCLYYNLAVPISGAFDWSGFLVLAAGDTIQALANSGASALTLTVSGVEST